MSEQINTTNIELSEQELDAVAGGAILDSQDANFHTTNNQLFSAQNVGQYGVDFLTAASEASTSASGKRETKID
jgi:hypothetical protein